MPSKFETAIKEKLLSKELEGKSYQKTDKKKDFIVIHNMAGTSEGSLSF